jgi:hypothetical protein
MFSLVSYLSLSLLFVGDAFGQSKIYFTNTPTSVTPGTIYNITWTGGSDSDVGKPSRKWYRIHN